MKKQTKVMATLSTAALLALGFSAVSMAAGWDNSTGAWRYLNNDGTEVTDEWKSANGNWFYLDDDGVMATDKLIEDTSSNNGKTKYYYVDQYGAMVKNTWKAVAMDDDSSDLDAEYWWYYFGNDGKAYTTDSDKLTKSKLKTINGLKYAFNEEGHMLYGWVEEDNYQTQDDTTEDRWKNATYYFNGWNDGHAQTGWAQLTVEDDDDTKDYWFYFGSDGVKQANKRKKINGVYYVFGENGNMVDEWAYQYGTSSWSEMNDAFKSGEFDASVSYLNGDGSQRKNTWVYAIPDEKMSQSDNDDDEYRWFYAGKNGKLVTDQIKKVNGKKYAFDNIGRMKTGFVKTTDGKAYEGTFKETYGDNELDYDDLTRDQWIAGDFDNLAFFSTDEAKDGAMKYGYQNIELDDGTYQFYFDKKNGQAYTKWNGDIKKFLINGMILKPSTDDNNNYAAVKVVDGEPVAMYTDYAKIVDQIVNEHATLYLVNTSGTKVTKKTVKDENDQYWRTNDKGVIVRYAVDKDRYDVLRDKKDDSKKDTQYWGKDCWNSDVKDSSGNALDWNF